MNIIRLYNQNRRKIFNIIFIVASIIFAIQLVNYLVKKYNYQNPNGEINSSSTGGTTTINQSQQSAISSSMVSDKVYKIQSELIDNFIKYCNEGNVIKAYELLSSDCKEVMFPTLEYFTNNYQKVIFSEEKIYSIQNWIGSTYRVRIIENILLTGKTNNGIAIEEYYTIISENGKNKLNINGFVERRKLNRKSSNKNIDIQAIYQDTYMDYVIYTLNVENNNEKIISLDSGESTQNMYVIDNKKTKHMSARNEVTNVNLKVLPYSEKDIQIKYYSVFSTTRELDTLVFNDIILDFNEYTNYSVKEDYDNRVKIEIEL